MQGRSSTCGILPQVMKPSAFSQGNCAEQSCQALRPPDVILRHRAWQETNRFREGQRGAVLLPRYAAEMAARVPAAVAGAEVPGLHGDAPGTWIRGKVAAVVVAHVPLYAGALMPTEGMPQRIGSHEIESTLGTWTRQLPGSVHFQMSPFSVQIGASRRGLLFQPAG